MRSGEAIQCIIRGTVRTAAALALASACGGSRHSKAVNIDHRMAEPVCKGVYVVAQDDLETYKVMPELSGKFKHPKNVITYLAVGSHTLSSSNNLGAASADKIDLQHDVGYALALQNSPQQPSRIRMFDYQNNTPPSLSGSVDLQGVPEVICPLTKLVGMAFYGATGYSTGSSS